MSGVYSEVALSKVYLVFFPHYEKCSFCGSFSSFFCEGLRLDGVVFHLYLWFGGTEEPSETFCD